MADICNYLRPGAGRASFDIERASLVRRGMGLIELALWTYEASKRHLERDMG